MSANEFARWREFYAQEPYCDEFTTRFAGAMVSSTLANVNRDSKKRSEPYNTLEFLPFFSRDTQKEAEPEQHIDELLLGGNW